MFRWAQNQRHRGSKRRPLQKSKQSERIAAMNENTKRVIEACDHSSDWVRIASGCGGASRLREGQAVVAPLEDMTNLERGEPGLPRPSTKHSFERGEPGLPRLSTQHSFEDRIGRPGLPSSSSRHSFERSEFHLAGISQYFTEACDHSSDWRRNASGCGGASQLREG